MKADWPSENIILGLLAEKPMHGYELAQRVRDDEALRAIWRIERSEVYFLLGKLVKSDAIREVDAPFEAGRPARVVYALTEAGQRVLDEWLGTPELAPRNLRTALLARVYIALRRDPRLAQDLIDRQKQVLEEWLAGQAGRQIDNAVVALVHDFRVKQVRATLDALDGMRALARAAD
jgi:DNA-binding PadR family transcriptional regulator